MKALGFLLRSFVEIIVENYEQLCVYFYTNTNNLKKPLNSLIT